MVLARGHIFKRKISNTHAWQMLFPDYSNLQERGNINKLYIIASGHLFPIHGLQNECT